MGSVAFAHPRASLSSTASTPSARSVNVKVATAPEATLASAVVATRFAESHPTFMPRLEKVVLSLLMPRFACDAVPRTHGAVPVFLK